VLRPISGSRRLESMDRRLFTMSFTRLRNVQSIAMPGADDGRSFSCTLSPYRQGELNGRARAGIARGPYPSSVSFDN
jgi:hypothetical protein